MVRSAKVDWIQFAMFLEQRFLYHYFIVPGRHIILERAEECVQYGPVVYIEHWVQFALQALERFFDLLVVQKELQIHMVVCNADYII